MKEKKSKRSIEPVEKLPVVYVNKHDKPGSSLLIANDPGHDGISDHLEDLKKPHKIVFVAQKDGLFDRMGTMLIKTLAGRIMARGVDIVAKFIPAGRLINAATDAIGGALKNVTQSPAKRTLTANNTAGKILYGLAGVAGAYFSGTHSNPHTMFHFNLLTLILMIASAGLTYGIKHLKDKPFIQLILKDADDIAAKAEAALSPDSDQGTKISNQEKQLILQTIKTKAEGISKQLVHKFFSGVLGHNSHQ